jgi:hypothetical protein
VFRQLQEKVQPELLMLLKVWPQLEAAHTAMELSLEMNRSPTLLCVTSQDMQALLGEDYLLEYRETGFLVFMAVMLE